MNIYIYIDRYRYMWSLGCRGLDGGLPRRIRGRAARCGCRARTSAAAPDRSQPERM